VDLWRKLEQAAMDAILDPGQLVAAGRVTYQFVPNLLRGTLLCWLPSGTWLAYPEARIKDIVKFEDAEPEPAIVYMHATYGPSSTYGGALAENITQAESATLLREALVTCEEWDLPVVLHVHDEIVVEIEEQDADDALADLEAVMNHVPDWADGLPIACDGEMGFRYKVPIARSE
jgi:DNA polymerase